MLVEHAQEVMVATLFGAGVVLCGALYAVFLTLARLAGMAAKRKLLTILSILCYGLLVINVFFLAVALDLRGWWLALIVVMVVGYFFAPRFIWKLSVAVHDDAGD